MMMTHACCLTEALFGVVCVGCFYVCRSAVGMVFTRFSIINWTIWFSLGFP